MWDLPDWVPSERAAWILYNEISALFFVNRFAVVTAYGFLMKSCDLVTRNLCSCLAWTELILRWSIPEEYGYGPLARYVDLRVAHAPVMPGTFSPPPRVSDSNMPHGTCVTHVLWCMSGSLTSGFLWCRENVPGILGACATAILRVC